MILGIIKRIKYITYEKEAIVRLKIKDYYTVIAKFSKEFALLFLVKVSMGTIFFLQE